MDEHTIPLEAQAKLTLSLRVTGVRDDGFHFIDAEMVTLDLADRLFISSGGAGLEIVGPFADGVNMDENNLVIRALRLCNREAHVRVDKRIPSGGGLGGGSADAAAILRWASFTDFVAASRLGADIPFFMVGGRARVQCIGEIVSPLPF
ncbi:MAG: GHMP family kinase ATP-binding protein, partial [Ilumatobacteraceae bacterium]